MPSLSDKPITRTGKLFGYNRRERKSHKHSLVTTEETTAWEIYNFRASQIDRDLIRDWNESLNTLLIFAALFSAVLTAFIVESMKMLQEDVAERTRDILLAISRQLANSSLPIFQPAEYRPPDFAVRVNGMFFMSLSCSLITALSAVLALQWVANYDIGLNTSSARKRALQRHMRFTGIRTWKVAELIACLPLLIFIALFLFFVGIADWLWHINQTISAIVMSTICIGFLLYAVTHVIGIIYIDAPFRTPMSKGSAALMRQGVNWIKSIASTFNPSSKRDHLRWPQLRQLWQSVSEGDSLTALNFAEYEENAFENDQRITVDSLLWIANSLEITQNSREFLLILVKEFLELPVELLIEVDLIKNAPWDSIFTVLCAPYSHPRDYTRPELEERRFLCKASSMLSTGIKTAALKSFHRSLAQSKDDSIITSVRLACYRHWEPDFPIQLIVRGACKCISTLSPDYFRFILLNVQKAWPMIDEFERSEIFDYLADACIVTQVDVHEKPVIPVIDMSSLDIIFDLVIQVADQRTRERGGTMEEMYVKAVEWINLHKSQRYDILKLHSSIRQQIVAQIACIDHSSENGHNQFVALLDRFLPMIEPEINTMQREEMDAFVSIMSMIYTKYRYKVNKLDQIFLTGLRQTCIGPNSDMDPWVSLVINFDSFLARRKDHSKDDYLAAIDTMESLLSHRSVRFSRLDSKSKATLTRIQDPSLALLLSWWCPEDWEFLAITQLDFGTWNENVEKKVFETWSHPSQDIISSKSHITFIRALIIHGPLSAKEGAVSLLERSRFEVTDGKKWHQVFRSPVLAGILDYYAMSGKDSIGFIPLGITKYEWFYEEFNKANGLNWLPPIILNRPSSAHAVLQLLVDQIVFPSASEGVGSPLSCSHQCIQVLGTIVGQISRKKSRTGIITSQFGEVTNLREALLWVLNKAIVTHDLPDSSRAGSFEMIELPHFATIAIKKRRWYGAQDDETRTFEFVKDMSGEEWDDWTANLRAMIMGISLGGLNVESTYRANKLLKDPDGICSLRALF
ncbi:hypothetical protein CPB86DRAFT_760725 [Serendipita vermifera]|nr:hypothetical protein CPB86DRAFT_760725 [Serendipita vermifera]